MEGLLWLSMCAYVIVGCFYYCASINRIVSFIKTMKRNEHIVNATSLIIVLMALIIAWPYLVWLDLEDYLHE